MKKRSPGSTTKGEALRNAILEAAAKLFLDRGFGSTSIQDIADALGITRTAVYYYFKNKDEIHVAFSERIVLAAKDATGQLAKRTDLDPVEALRRLVQNHTALVLSRQLEFRAGGRDQRYLPPKHRAVVLEARRTVLENFTQVIERGMKLGRLRTVDARLAAYCLIGMCNWSAWWYEAGGQRSIKEVADMIADLAVHSLKREDRRTLKKGNVRESLHALRDEMKFLERALAGPGTPD
jgi:AcrR family transcriptional regulator